MKKIFVSVGLVAVGAAGLQSANAQSMDASASPKIWNASATLRGFYDDNYTYSHNKSSSFGFQVNPSISANLALQQTDIGIRYTYGMYYYQKREDIGQNPIDHTHQADLWVDHAFNARWKANVTDSLAIGQDPKLLDGSGAVTRSGGNNLANRARVAVDTDWTPQFSTEIHYGNNLYIFSKNSYGDGVSAAALLNRIEQDGGIDFQWHFQPETMGFVGYDFTAVRYNGDAPIVASGYPYVSADRDHNSHYAYVGIQHQFTPSLKGMARGGVVDTDNYNDPVSPSTSLAPYADVNLTYTYLPGSYLQAGFTQNINSTDVAFQNGGNGGLTLYQQSSTFYADINHQFTPKLTGSVNSQYQYSSYKGGGGNGSGDNYVSVDLNLNYQIDTHLSANAGYNFGDLSSDISGRGYTRNMVYIGLGANY